MLQYLFKDPMIQDWRGDGHYWLANILKSPHKGKMPELILPSKREYIIHWKKMH